MFFSRPDLASTSPAAFGTGSRRPQGGSSALERRRRRRTMMPPPPPPQPEEGGNTDRGRGGGGTKGDIFFKDTKKQEKYFSSGKVIEWFSFYLSSFPHIFGSKFQNQKLADLKVCKLFNVLFAFFKLKNL